MKIVVVGGGAAGFFSALSIKELNPDAQVSIFEKSDQVLSKLRISGGKRCNVTNACFDPKLLVENYPRGHKELLGPFHRFQPRDTIKWFESRGVILKEEKDKRMFPITDSSSTIADCFLKEAKKLKIEIFINYNVQNIRKGENGVFELDIFNKKQNIFADAVILATGSSKEGYFFAKNLGHTIKEPVPSLFSFNIKSFSLSNLAGVSVDNVRVRLKDSKFEQTGPLLITHRGFTGPVILKLSSFNAKFLSKRNYNASLFIDWLPEYTEEKLFHLIKAEKNINKLKIFHLPKNLLEMLYKLCGLSGKPTKKTEILKFIKLLKNDCYKVLNKLLNNNEFVTCGGVTLSEVNFKTMESKCCQNLFFCGEILDIDGLTGGFNFQNAWTTGWIAARGIKNNEC